MDSNGNEIRNGKFTERIRKSWLPFAAVGGALVSFVAAGLRTRPEPESGTDLSNSEAHSGSVPIPEAPEDLKEKYLQTLVLGGKGSAHRFKHSLSDVAVDSKDVIYGLGDNEIRIFKPNGDFLKSWSVDVQSTCIEVGPDGRIYIGLPGRVAAYSPSGEKYDNHDVGDRNKKAAVTAIKFVENDILVADANTRIIYRYDVDWNLLNVIGDRNKTGSFMLPNKWLDLDVAPNGILYATDTGRHRVTGWMPDGSSTGFFGKFGQQNPSDFVGCCNPVNLAVTPDLKIVTAEKVAARVKVFDLQGTMVAYIGPEHFHPNCRNIHLAVDSLGRILTADPMQREIKIFTASTESREL